MLAPASFTRIGAAMLALTFHYCRLAGVRVAGAAFCLMAASVLLVLAVFWLGLSLTVTLASWAGLRRARQ